MRAFLLVVLHCEANLSISYLYFIFTIYMGQLTTFFSKLLDTADFPARWHCGKWSDFHGWLYILSDIGIWSAYFAIPLLLFYIVSKGKIPFLRIFWLFIAFIALCGTTHLLDAVIFWEPLYRLSAVVRAATAIVSWITVFTLIKIMPVAARLRSPEQLENTIREQTAELEEMNEELNVTNAKLTQSQDHFKLLIENNPSLISIFDPGKRILFVNQTFTKATGLSPTYFVGKTYYEAGYPKQFVDEFYDKMEQVFKTHETVTYETGSWSGNEKYYVITMVPMTVNDDSRTIDEVMVVSHDITIEKQAADEIKKAHEQTLESERQFKALVENNPDVIARYNRKLQHTFISSSVHKIRDDEESYYIGKKPTELANFDKASMEDIEKYLQTVFETGEPLSFTTEDWDVPVHDQIILDVSVVPIKNPDTGEIEEVMTISRDVTDLRVAKREAERSNQRLKISRRRFKKLIDNHPDYISVIDKDYNYTYVNETTLKATGADMSFYKKRSYLDMNYEEEVTKLHTQKLEEAAETKGMVQYETMLTPKEEDLPPDSDRKYWYLEVIIVPVFKFKTDKEAIEYIIITKDVTILKERANELEELNNRIQESEQLFRSLVENNPDAICKLDRDLKLTFVSPSISDVRGWEQEKYLGKSLHDLGYSDEEVTKYQMAFRTVERTGQPTTIENVITKNLSEPVYFSVRVVPLYHNNEDKPSELLTVSRDITFIRRTQEELKSNIEHLEEVTSSLSHKNRQLQDFAHIVSHNLRSPVGNLTTLFKFYDDVEEAMKPSILEKIREVSDNLFSTVDDLTEVIRIRQAVDIKRDKLRFEEVLKHQQSLISAKIMESEAVITHNFEVESIDYPKVYLESIMLNLLTNSIKYKSPKRTPEVHFETKEHNLGQITLTCQDNGLGIDMERNGHKLFGLHKTFHRNEDARGVGLYITKNQIEALGGTISAVSTKGEGTTFTVVFNIRKES